MSACAAETAPFTEITSDGFRAAIPADSGSLYWTNRNQSATITRYITNWVSPPQGNQEVVLEDEDLAWTLFDDHNKYNIEAVGDFDLDGDPDLIIRKPRDDRTRLILLDGAGTGDADNVTLVANIYIGKMRMHRWTVLGVGDVNHDGRQDVVWNSGSRRPSVWSFEYYTRAYVDNCSSHNNCENRIVSYELNPGSESYPRGAGAVADVNRDGVEDLIWMENDYLSIWTMRADRENGISTPVLDDYYQYAYHGFHALLQNYFGSVQHYELVAATQTRDGRNAILVMEVIEENVKRAVFIPTTYDSYDDRFLVGNVFPLYEEPRPGELRWASAPSRDHTLRGVFGDFIDL